MRPNGGRNQVALLTALSNAANRGLTMVMILLAAHWTLPYLGPERLGVWMTLLSLAALLSFLDLGVGNALTNHVAKARVLGAEQASKAIQGGVVLVGLIALVVFALLQALHGFVPWGRLFKLSDAATLAEVESALRWLYLLFAMQIVSTAGVRVAYGLQQGYSVNLMQVALCLAATGALYALSAMQAGLVAVLFGVFLPVSVAGWCYLLWQLRHGAWGVPGAAAQARLQAPELLGSGGLFFVLQLATLAAWGADTLIVSATLGAAAVVPYALAQRLFQFVSQPLAIVNNSLWPAYADAHARGDTAYIAKTTRKSALVSGAGAVVGSLVMLALCPWLLGLISDGQVQPSPVFVSLFATWVLCEVAGYWASMRFNGTGQIRVQVLVMTLFVVVSVPLKVWAAGQHGLEGMLVVGVVAYVALVLLPYGVMAKVGVIK